MYFPYLWKIEKFLLIISFSFLAPGFAFSNSKKAAELKCNWGSYNPAPYIILDEEVPKSGIIKDICEALANEIGVNAKLVKTPRKRAVQLCESGKTDIIITANKKWLPNLAKSGNWLPPLFKAGKTLVFQEKDKGLSAIPLEKLEGLRIGAVMGNNYHNKTLNQKFKNGQLIRVNAKSEEAGIKMTIHGRVDATISERISFYYQKTLFPRTHQNLIASDEDFTSSDITPVLCSSSNIDFKKLEQATKKLLKKGAFEKIMSKYK